MAQTIAVASQNPVKIEATRIGFGRMFPDVDFTCEGASVASGVSDQPMSHTETLTGAENRAQNVASALPTADYHVGIEGGIEIVAGKLEVFAWVVIHSSDTIGRAQTGVFYLPDEVAQLVQRGIELGDADDIVFRRENSKQQSGSIGILTDDVLTRTDYYVNAVIMALIPFKRPHLTW